MFVCKKSLFIFWSSSLTGFNHIDILIHHSCCEVSVVLFSTSSFSIFASLFFGRKLFSLVLGKTITELFFVKRSETNIEEKLIFELIFLFRVRETATTTKVYEQTNKENNIKEKVDINS